MAVKRMQCSGNGGARARTKDTVTAHLQVGVVEHNPLGHAAAQRARHDRRRAAAALIVAVVVVAAAIVCVREGVASGVFVSIESGAQVLVKVARPPAIICAITLITYGLCEAA